MSSQIADAPVAMITLSPRYSVPRAQTRNGRAEKSTRSMSTSTSCRAEALRLLAEAVHELRPVDALGEARVVLDLAGEHQLAAGRGARDDDGLEVGARRVDGGGEAGRARADDEDLRLGPMTCRGLPAVAVPEGFGSAGCIAADHRDGARRTDSGCRSSVPEAGFVPLPPSASPPKSIFRPPNGLAGWDAGSRSALSSDMSAS